METGDPVGIMPLPRKSHPVYLAIREALIVARKARGWSQVQLDKRLGYADSIIARIETGERRIDLLEVLALCRALGMSRAAQP